MLATWLLPRRRLSAHCVRLYRKVAKPRGLALWSRHVEMSQVLSIKVLEGLRRQDHSECHVEQAGVVERGDCHSKACRSFSSTSSALSIMIENCQAFVICGGLAEFAWFSVLQVVVVVDRRNHSRNHKFLTKINSA